MLSSLFATLLFGAAAFSPPQVPAQGEQEALLELGEPAFVRLTAESASGTACTLVDQRRGPFARAGVAGRENCALELLLDPGRYKLRLRSPAKGEGTVKLSAVPFAEVAAVQPLLQPGVASQLELPRGKQASFWIHRDAPGPVLLRVAGRTAGLVELWHDGQWRAPHEEGDLRSRPRPDRPIHEWLLEPELPAGDTRVTVYGVEPLRWGSGEESDRLSVQLGAPPMPAGGAIDAELPWSGLLAWQLPLPKEQPAALLHIVGEPGHDATTLELLAQPEALAPARSDGGCKIEGSLPLAAARTPRSTRCFALARSEASHLAVVRGRPGTRVRLQLASWRTGVLLDGEAQRSGGDLLLRVPSAGSYLVGLREAPATIDEAPLSCALARETGKEGSGEWQVFARSYLPVSSREPFERSFNRDGGTSEIWFEVGDWGLYTAQTRGGNGERCALFAEDDAGQTRLVGESDPAGKACKLSQMLTAGRYQLRLSGGARGVETLRIAALTSVTQEAPTRSTCLLRAELQAQTRYRLLTSRRSGSEARLAIARKLPLQLEGAPLLIDLDPGAVQRLPIAAGGQVIVTGPSDAEFACSTSATSQTPAAAAQGGRCTVQLAAGAELLLFGRGKLPAPLSIGREERPAAEPARVAANPKPVRLPELLPDKPLPLDLEPGPGKTLTFTVQEGGLWQLTTQGLLETSCALRTPAVAALATDARSGRGRNCLVSGVLSPGRYAATIAAVGRSRGRAWALLTRRAPLEGPPLTAGGAVFFRSGDGQLVTQKVAVPAAGRYRLSVAAQGAALSCRLEDEQGWPVREAPSSCSLDEVLPKGTLLLSQLPLTVESQRRALLAKVHPPKLLTGDRPHRLLLNQTYGVRLSKRGFDLLRFKLEARLPIDVLLTAGMQGRLYREGEKTPLEVLAPQGAAAESEPAEEPLEESAADAPAASDDVAPAAEEGEGAEPCEGEECAPPTPVPERRERPRSRAPREASGPQRLVLEPGSYTLRTEHSRADAAVSYQVALTTAAVAPGLTTAASVPESGAASLLLVMPQTGTLRLRTVGDSDVRCRLYSASGALLASSDDDGDDWNCAFTGPLAKGDYRLSIESQTRTAGSTEVVAQLARSEERGTLAPGTLALGPQVLSGLLPQAGEDAATELHATSAAPFGCALEDAGGGQLLRLEDTRDCSLLALGGPAPLRLRLWNRGAKQEVKVALAARTTGGRDALEEGKIALVQVPRDGRYDTGEELFCLGAGSAAAGRLLKPCGPEAFLEKGPLLLARMGGAKAPLALRERTARLAAEQEATWTLEGAPRLERQVTLQARRSLERQVADGERLLLLELRAPAGSRTQPLCSLAAEGHAAVRKLDAEGCVASAGLAREALLRASSASGNAGPATATLRAIEAAKAKAALEPGRSSLSLQADAVRFALPAGPVRLELLLPAEAWAVLVDGDGGAIDLCAGGRPGALPLAGCALLSPERTAQLVVWSPRERRFEAAVTVLPAAPKVISLGQSGLFEAAPLAPGVEVVQLAAAGQARSVTAEGASRCLLERQGGVREEACTAGLEPGEAAVLRLLHEGHPLRVAVHAAGAAAAAFAGPAGAGTPAPLEAGRALALSGTAAAELRVEARSEQVLHLRARGAACALRSEKGEVLAQGGLGAGCVIDRLLAPGAYRVTARPFAGLPMQGELVATFDEVLPAAEGTGPELFIGPGESRLLRFTTASAGEVGLGLQAQADALFCSVLDEEQRPLGEGCQQLLHLPQGRFLLQLRSPEGAPPLRARPVLLGLSGALRGVPDEVLRDLFSRVGELP
jgi:hypothetical protein